MNYRLRETSPGIFSIDGKNGVIAHGLKIAGINFGEIAKTLEALGDLKESEIKAAFLEILRKKNEQIELKIEESSFNFEEIEEQRIREVIESTNKSFLDFKAKVNRKYKEIDINESGFCLSFSTILYKKISQALEKKDVKLVQGVFNCSYESSFHNWCDYKGRIIDLTLMQFSQVLSIEKIDTKNGIQPEELNTLYSEEQVYTGKKLEELCSFTDEELFNNDFVNAFGKTI